MRLNERPPTQHYDKTNSLVLQLWCDQVFLFASTEEVEYLFPDYKGDELLQCNKS